MRTASTVAPGGGAKQRPLIGNARINDAFPVALAELFEDRKRRSQEREKALPTLWQFAGEILVLKPHWARWEWRQMLHLPSIHLDVGAGRRYTALAQRLQR
jgi:hypothetical protein